MLSRIHNFTFYPNYNFATTGVFVQQTAYYKSPLPPVLNFRITDASDTRIINTGESRVIDT